MTEMRGGSKAIWAMAKYTGHFSHGHFCSEKGSLSAKTSISLWVWLWKDRKPRTKELKLPPEYNYAHRNCNHPYNNFKQKQLSRSWFLWQLGLGTIDQGHLIAHFFKALQDISYPKNISNPFKDRSKILPTMMVWLSWRPLLAFCQN